MTDTRRYEISILIGPCSEKQAESAMQIAHEAITDLGAPFGPGTALNWWDEESECPGDPVPNVDVI